MIPLRIVCWNVNGLRAMEKKGFVKWVLETNADLVCLQETKAEPSQLSQALTQIPGYEVQFVSAQKKGYSGVAIYSKRPLGNIRSGLGFEEFDHEGRVLAGEIAPNVTLFNIYFPNGKASPERLAYKMRFYEQALKVMREELGQGRSVILCGDVNTAHREIDLSRPKENEMNSGFLPQEREWIDRLLEAGFVDIFRKIHPEPNQYSWWDLKTRARERNVGWRIDYFFVSEDLLDQVTSAELLSDIMGSDHCPLELTLRL